MSHNRLAKVARGRRVGLLLLAPAVVLTMAAVGWPGPRVEVAGAESQEQLPAPVRRPLHNMVEGYAEGQVVAIEYLSTFYCPTTPSSDLDGPFGRGNGRPQSEDAGEYQVPPCFFGDTGTGSIPPPELHYGAFHEVKTFFGLAPWFPGPDGASGPPGAAVVANSPASDVDTHCTEPGPPVTEQQGQRGTCLMHPTVLRVAKVFDDPSRQPPDPLIGAQHSHLLPETAASPGWWNIRGVAIYDRSIWPDRDGNCPAGPPFCVTSVAAMRAAQKTGQASTDFPSNIYWYMAVHPEEH
ncbi:MAG: hypothetical protein ACRDYF_10220 [Acidimicrobiia bacterium]